MSRKPKRPSSARRNIKLETFSPFVSNSRLHNVQMLLRDKDEKDSTKPDALLCITGIDSRYNEGTNEVVNYLLFGFFESRKTELENSGFEEEVIEDLVFVIRKHEVDIYCNPVNYHYLLPYVSHWRNLRIHCFTEEEYEDEEKAGEFKVKTFISIAENLQLVGIPFSSSGHCHKFDKMVVEKWPLVQAYALEDFGGKGFFTLNHDVLDLSAPLHQVYRYMDPVFLENIVTEQLPLFERQWNTMLTTIDVDISSSKVPLTEEKVYEPLSSYYRHGMVGGGEITQEKPFVLFGLNSKKTSMDTVLSTGKLPSNSNVMTTGVSGEPAKLMLCRGVSPRCPLNCLRTYFFPDIGGADSCSPLGQEDETSKILVQVYSAMIDSVLDGIHVYAQTLSVNKARSIAVSKLCDNCAKIQNPVLEKYMERKSNIVFNLDAYDNLGRPCTVEEGKRQLLIKSLTLKLLDMPSLQHPGKTCGTLGYSELFLDSIIKVQKSDGTFFHDSDVLLLTENVPRYKAWKVTKKKNSTSENMTNIVQGHLKDTSLTPLMSGEKVQVGTASMMHQDRRDVDLFLYTNALVIQDPKTSSLFLDGTMIKSLQFYDGGSMSTVNILVIEMKPAQRPHVPGYLSSPSNKIYITFNPKSKAHKLMYSDVLPKWKENTQLPQVERIDTVPSDFLQIHSVLQKKYQTSSSLSSFTGFARATNSLLHLKMFLSHFSASSVSDRPIPQNMLPSLKREQQMRDTDRSIAEENKQGEITLIESSEEEKQFIVTIVCGIEDVHKEMLCETLLDVTKDRFKWTVIKPEISDPQKFLPSIQQSLQTQVNMNKRRRAAGTTKSHVLVISPGYTDIVDVVHAIYCHPDSDVKKVTKIGAVTVCVDPSNFFVKRKLTFPNLLNQCSQGWVNNIFFTTSASSPSPLLSDIQSLLRAVNSDVAFFMAEDGKITRSNDIDAILSESSFMEEEKIRARHLLYPAWSLGSYKPQKLMFEMNTVTLRFSKPLMKHTFISKLNGLQNSFSEFPCHGNVYFVKGTLSFTESPAQKMNLNFSTLVNSLVLKPSREDQMTFANGDGLHVSARGNNFLVFTGCQLQESPLKDLLRLCVKQVPQKRELMTRKDVTKDEIKRIHKQHHLEPLPEGWFYNGFQFVSFDGEKQDLHPNLETFISQYLERRNKEICDYNARADEAAKSFVDLFA